MNRNWKVYSATAFALALGLIMAKAWADGAVRVGSMPTALVGTFQTTVVTTSGNQSGFGKNQILYGFSVHPSASNAECGLYDALTLGTTSNTQGVFIDEGGSATQFNTFQSNWPGPYRLTTGLTVVLSAGRCIIYHDPKTFPS